MRTEAVEIYSDQINAAVLRHPERRFPGVLVQGDTLHHLCSQADSACQLVDRASPGYEEINDVRNALWKLLSHYKDVLIEHEIALPFSEQFSRF